MEPEKGQKSTRKSEEGVRKRPNKGEVVQGTETPTEDYPGSRQEDLLSQQHFPSSLKIAREGPPRRVGRPCKPKVPLLQQLHVSKSQTVSPAFMAPRMDPEHGLKGSAWQVVDPVPSGPSKSSSALHARLSRLAEDPSQKAYVQRPTQVSVKQVDEPHKKEKKPQKPGKYICQYCSRPCAKPSVLQKHIRSHTGERPYPCIPCGFSFKTKSNLYKHRKSHAHRIKAGLTSETGTEAYPSSLEMERLGGEEIDEPSEGESTDSEDETSTMSNLTELSPQQKHHLSSSESQGISRHHSTRQDLFSLSQQNMPHAFEESVAVKDPSPELLLKSEDTHTIKQKLALRLSERKKASEEQTFLSPGSKGSTESGYFSRSESAEQQISPPNTNAKSYAEIILGKCGRIGQRTSILPSVSPNLGTAEEKTSSIPMSLPRTQVIEHITKLITINEAVVDTSEIDSVKPRRSSLSRRSSIESPKATLYRENFQFDVKSPGSLQLDSKMSAEKTKAEHCFTSHQQSHSATETVPLLRSHSMPSSACTISSPHPFRASYSFDDRIVDSEALSHSHMLSSHPRMLKRQPAIELPLGMEYSSEEGNTTSKDTPGKSSEDLEAKETEVSRKSKKGGRVKGLIYECNICGARYKKRGNYETHKKYYCSEMQILEPPVIVPSSSVETGKGYPEHEAWSPLPNYKLGPSLELSTLRKRRKEKSLGDDEEPQSAEWSEFPTSSIQLESCYSSPNTSLNLSSDTVKQSTSRSETAPKSDIHALTYESKEKSTISKEISVIQHTSSFEKSESMEKRSSFDEEEAPYRTVRQHPHSSHTLQPKLVRQHNIQVPEILVTEEPDKPEVEPEDPLKEPEKVEEFQWPQRSQTLAQLPAEKLPPKKKRLRLAEMAQSSGDSSFESTTLTRSPSQDSSISHASSHSVSFDREEGSKQETSGQHPETTARSIGHHMLTVPSHHHQAREMRRSASEQTPNVSHTLQVSENRSKSFDYGNLTSTATSMLTAQERRKCFSIRQTSLSRHVELEPELSLRDWKEPEQPSSSSHVPGKSCFGQSSVTSPAEQQQNSPSSQPKQKPSAAQTLTDEIKKRHQVSLFPVQPLLRLSEHASELLSSQTTSSIISAPFSLGPISPSVFNTPPLSLPPSLLHPDHLSLSQQLTLNAMDIPFRQHSPYLHSSYPVSLPFLPTIFMPVHSQFALPLPAQAGEHYSQIIPQVSPPLGASSHSSSQDYFSENIRTPSHSQLPLESTAQVIPACPEPAESVVVPVRIQTDMPLYGNAMYTTLSQILVTQSHRTSSSIVIQKINEGCSKGFSFDLSDVLPKEQSSIDEIPFLRVPFPRTETNKYIPLTSSVEGVLGFDGSSSSVGGSKRMLSPAGSLELTMETQQQKRVKEEEDTEEIYETDTIKSHSILEESRTSNIATGMKSQSRLNLLAPEPTAVCEQQFGLERIKTQIPPSALHPLYSKSQEKPQSQDDSITVKEEKNDKDLDLSTRPTASQTPVNIHLTVSHEETESKNLQVFPTLHTTTNVSWCYLNYVKPNHTQQTDPRTSVYSSWCISLYNPNLPGVSTRVALSLLRSKQKKSSEIYTTADAIQADSSLLVPSRTQKPKMSETHLPVQVFKETSRTVKDEEKRVKSEDSGPSVKRGESSRVRIFEGGYKSNEEYVYVRGRGRGKYVCEECGIRCKKPSMLKKHIRTHTDHRPYMCKHCNFAFKTKGNLTKHMKSKAHSKKCQELGLVPPSLSELDAEEGTSDERWPDSDVVEEHQFSDLEDTEDDDDSDEEDEEDDDDDSQEEKNPDPDPSPITATYLSPDELRQKLEIADFSSVCQFSPQPLQTSELLDKDPQTRPVSEHTRELSHRRWSPGKDTGSSRPGPSRRHLLQKKESSTKCFSTTGCTSPRRGMSPCHRLTSAREGSPLRCISPQHLSPHRSLSPRAFMSPERGSSPPARHLSPSREMASLRYPAFRGGLASPPRYPSPGREESHLSRSDAQIHLKAQHGVFSSTALPHKASGSLEASGIKKPGPSSSSSRSLCSLVMPHVLRRSGENLYTHLPLHSQHLQRTPYPMIPIGGIQMVQARPSPQPSLLGPVFPGLHSEGPDKEASQQPQERNNQQLRTNQREEEEDRVVSPPSTAPQHSPTPSTYCQTACTPPPPPPGTPLVHTGSLKGERLEGEG